MSIVRQWNLKEGDKLDWSWEVRNNEMLVVIRRLKKKDQVKGSLRKQIGRRKERKVKCIIIQYIFYPYLGGFYYEPQIS